MDGGIKSESVAESFQRQIATSAGISGSGLFPPGLEALYRQAGFPSAFLGLAAASGSAAAAAAAGGSGPGGGSGGSGSNRDSPTSSITGIAPTVPQVGLQSHAGNPNRE